jgi:nicotinamidase-related amidase
MDPQMLGQHGRSFLNYLADWHARLPTLDLAAEIREPECAAVISEDLVKGFCTIGPLSSPRVQAIVAPIVRLFERAYALGIPNFVLAQDTHEPDAIEFGSFPPHCVQGTEESETIPELATLPFAGRFTIIRKNSIASILTPSFQDWLAQHPDVSTFIVVGDCTDICVYQTAMGMRVRANAQQKRNVRVIVPSDCVDTYDLPVDVARSLGSLPHAGDLLHLIFLYHMALNGIQVVATAN